MIIYYHEHGEGKKCIEDIIQSMYDDKLTKKSIQMKSERWGITESRMALIVAEHLKYNRTDFIS